MLRLCCLMILVVGATAAASSSSSSSTKREDPSTGGSGGGSQPVYSPSVAASSYSSSAYDAGDAGSSYKAQPNSQGNLYYYYYPVQEKAQDNAYASSSTHNYATAPASNSGYESGDSASNTYHSAQASDSYSSQDATYAGALNQLSGYGLANGYSLGSTGLSSAGLGSAALNAAALGSGGLNSASLGSYGIGGLSPGYAAAGIPAAYAAGGSLGNYPAGSAAVANYAPQSSLAQYAAHLTGYGNQYGASTGYGVAQGYGTPSRRYGLGSLLVPMIALAGLTMLIPSVTSSLGSRTKRSTNEEVQKNPLTLITEYKDKLERYYSIYRTAVEKEECMNRIICEIGSAVSDVKGKGAVVLIMEKLLPKSMRSKMNVFKAGALSGEIGKCKKLFKC